MKKKQMLAALMGVAMLSTLLAGCGGGDKEGSSEPFLQFPERR